MTGVPGRGDSSGSVQTLGWPPSLQGAGSVAGTTWGGKGRGGWGWGLQASPGLRGVVQGGFGGGMTCSTEGLVRLLCRERWWTQGGVPSWGC